MGSLDDYIHSHGVGRRCRRRAAALFVATLGIVALVGCRGGATPAAPAEPMEVRITVGGMVCEGCANAVQQRLARVEGVESVEVDYQSAEATIRYDAAAVKPAELALLIEELGYVAELGEPRVAAPAAPAGAANPSPGAAEGVR